MSRGIAKMLDRRAWSQVLWNEDFSVRFANHFSTMTGSNRIIFFLFPHLSGMKGRSPEWAILNTVD